MITVVMVCTGDKYPRSAVSNIEYQLHNAGFQYDRTHVITRGEGSVYDKLKMFEQCTKDEHYVYFDLDLVIMKNVDLIRDEFTLLYAWWRAPYHTPLNSSVMAWRGDKSYIAKNFRREKYDKGIDEYFFRECTYRIYDRIAWSWAWDEREHDFPICLFNHDVEIPEWTTKYML